LTILGKYDTLEERLLFQLNLNPIAMATTKDMNVNQNFENLLANCAKRDAGMKTDIKETTGKSEKIHQPVPKLMDGEFTPDVRVGKNGMLEVIED
jgi:hypothetical protein